MSKTLKRLLTSLALSIGCAGAVHWWYVNGDSTEIDYGNQQPIARITEFSNEVHRRPLKRLIWQPLSQNDPLFGGEQVRTPGNATAVLELIDSGTVIELDPGSLITLEKSDGKLSLDFLQGNLFVKAGEGRGEELSLKTDGKELKVGSAELSVGKGKDGQLDVQVFKGNVEGAQGAKDPFEIISPAPFAEVFVFSDQRKSIRWEWKNAFEPRYRFRLEMGPRRDQLQTVSNVALEANRILGTTVPGDHFWRVVAFDPANPQDEISSRVYKLKAQAIRPPLPLAPQNAAQLAVLDTDPKVEMKWANPGGLKGLTLEIAESADLKKGYQKISAAALSSHVFPVKKNGSVYWRLTGFLPRSNEAVVSEVFQFNTSLESGIKGPELVAPLDRGRVQGDSKRRPTVDFQWTPVAGVNQYHLIIEGPKPGEKRDLIAAEPRLRTDQLQPGEYKWKVYAVGEGGKRSPDSLERTFSVTNLPQVLWKNPAEKITFFYYSPAPELSAEWVPFDQSHDQYQVFFRKAGESEDKNQLATSKSPAVRLALAEEGEWIVQVEALKEKEVVARSEEKTFEVKVAPLLPAPNFVEGLPNPVRADRRGGVSLKWNPVPEAVGYRVDLVDSSGSVLKTMNTNKAEIAVQKLKPGKLEVKVQAIDQAQRRGIASEAREVIVPDKSDVRAPKMMKFEVK